MAVIVKLFTPFTISKYLIFQEKKSVLDQEQIKTELGPK